MRRFIKLFMCILSYIIYLMSYVTSLHNTSRWFYELLHNRLDEILLIRIGEKLCLNLRGAKSKYHKVIGGQFAIN